MAAMDRSLQFIDDPGDAIAAVAAH